MKKLVVTGFIFSLAILLIGAQQAYSYELVTTTPNGGCVQCHPSTTLHTAHSSITDSCVACHPTSAGGAGNVEASTCSECHPVVGEKGACPIITAHANPSTGANSCLECHAACAQTGEGDCQDWLGTWQFTYDNNTTDEICFDNTSIGEDTITLCDNEAQPNCQCIQGITSDEICIDTMTFEQCDNDSIAGCECFDNPLFRNPSVAPGTYDVVITNVQENVTLNSIELQCYATGTRGAQSITIAQPSNAALADFAETFPNVFDNGTYLVYEGSIDNAATLLFSQIPEANFQGSSFTTASEYNFLGLASGTKGTVPPDGECTLNIIPARILRLLTFINPFSPFIIFVPQGSDIEFSRPISIDFGTDAINDIARVLIGNKIIIGFGFVRPFQLEPDTYDVTVSYGQGDNETECATLEVR